MSFPVLSLKSFDPQVKEALGEFMSSASPPVVTSPSVLDIIAVVLDVPVDHHQAAGLLTLTQVGFGFSHVSLKGLKM